MQLLRRRVLPPEVILAHDGYIRQTEGISAPGRRQLVIAATDLGRWAPPAGRGTRERITLDIVEETAFALIDDAFNANPSSMAAALEVLIAATPQDGVGKTHKGRRIAILGDMLELGADAVPLRSLGAGAVQPAA